MIKNISLTLLISLFFSLMSFSQIPHKKPYYPTGTIASQMEALPHYNEACELYKNGEDSLAIIALLEAINISFELVEAQLFLADIYYKHKRFEEAFIYYNSGIDFYLNVPPYYYFQVLTLGMYFGEYEQTKHNLGNFKKTHAKKVEGLAPYQDGISFNAVDYEYFLLSLELVYNYESWQGNYTVNQLEVSQFDYLIFSDSKLILVNKIQSYIAKWKKNKFKKYKKYNNLPTKIENPSISKTGKYLVYQMTENNQTKIYFSIKESKNWSNPILMKGEINEGNFNGYPFLSNNDSIIYFSSNRNGSKDLFEIQVDLKENKTFNLKELKWLNTERDEIAPFLLEDSKIFYFSSNGYPGFGGFDIFECKDYEIVYEKYSPMNPFNMKYPINSNEDDMMVDFISENKGFLMRKDVYGNTGLHEFNRLKEKRVVDFEIQILDLSDNE